MAIKTMEVDKYYQVRFGGGVFTVTVAKSSAAVRDWIGKVESDHAERIRRNKLVAGISLQWTKDSTDLLQLCVGGSVLIVLLRYLYRIPTALHRFLNLSSGVHLYGLGVGSYKQRLAGDRRLKMKTNYIHDLYADGNGNNSTASLLVAARVPDLAQALACLEDKSIIFSNWKQTLHVNQVLHASLKAIVPFHLSRC